MEGLGSQRHVWAVLAGSCSSTEVRTAVLFNGSWNRFNPVLTNGVHLGDPAGSLQDAVALPEVAPPHVLVGDLDDVPHGEPALLPVRQADALVHAWGDGGGRRRRRTEGRSEVFFDSCEI